MNTRDPARKHINCAIPSTARRKAGQLICGVGSQWASGGGWNEGLEESWGTLGGCHVQCRSLDAGHTDTCGFSSVRFILQLIFKSMTKTLKIKSREAAAAMPISQGGPPAETPGGLTA